MGIQKDAGEILLFIYHVTLKMSLLVPTNFYKLLNGKAIK